MVAPGLQDPASAIAAAMLAGTRRSGEKAVVVEREVVEQVRKLPRSSSGYVVVEVPVVTAHHFLYKGQAHSLRSATEPEGVVET